MVSPGKPARYVRGMMANQRLSFGPKPSVAPTGPAGDDDKGDSVSGAVTEASAPRVPLWKQKLAEKMKAQLVPERPQSQPIPAPEVPPASPPVARAEASQDKKRDARLGSSNGDFTSADGSVLLCEHRGKTIIKAAPLSYVFASFGLSL
jgi:hypothetical protein